MYFWYKLLTYLFYPFTPFFLFLRKLKKKEHPIRYKEKLSQINTPRGEGFLIWFHVASVGEAMSILPLDISVWTNKFLEHWKPNLCIFIDSEIWPNLILNINKKEIPLLLINARITKKRVQRDKKGMLIIYTKNT